MMHRIPLSFIILFTIMTMAIGTTAASVSAQGNSENAKLCQKDGWQDLQGSNGEIFANQDQCVSYAAHGGDLEELVVEPFLTVEWVTRTYDYGDVQHVQVSAIITGGGLQPGAPLDLYLNNHLYSYHQNLTTVAEDGTLYLDRTGDEWFSCGFSSAVYQTIDRDGNVIRSTDGVATHCP